MLKKLKIIAITACVISVPLAISVYAFFTYVSHTTIGSFAFIPPQNSNNSYLVSSESDLRKIAKDEKFNSNSKVSDKDSRKIIKLINNITLTGDLEMSIDFNLDLNGKTINLAGHKLTVKHGFSSDIAIFGGTIISSPGGGKLIFDTPNATQSIASSVIDSSLIEYLSYDAAALKDRVFDFVDNQLQYGSCGNYYYTDIILPNHYYTYDIKFDYTSSDQNVLSNDGKLINNSTTKLINYSLQITVGGNVYVKQVPISVWVVPLSNRTKWFEIAEELFDNSIARYLGEDNYYSISNNIMLTQGVTYPGITYSYSTLNSLDLSGGNTLLARAVSGEIPLTVTPTIGGINGTPFVRNFKVTAPSSNYQIVSDAMDEMFPNGSVAFNSLTDIYAIPDVSGFPGTISFSFLNSSTNYLINNRVLSVNSLNPPSLTTQNYLNIDFYFNDANSTHIIRRVKLNFTPTDGSDSGGPGGTDYFYDFYYYLNSLLTERTNNLYTYSSFIMPKSFNNSVPKLQYRIVTKYANGSAYTGANIITVTDNGTSWGININTANVPMNDMLITVYYKYTFNASSENYIEYSQNRSFIVPGIAHLGTDIADQNLYNAMRTAYCPSETELLSSSLSNDKAMFELHNNTVANFKGIQYLTNTHSFDFSGCAFNQTSFTYLNALNNLTTLNLSANGLTDISSLPLLVNLTTLNVSGNSINRFDCLEKFKGLLNLYVYGQTGTQINYGNSGIYNSYTFVSMSIGGVSVYKADASTKFIPSADQKKAANVLSGVIYQKAAPTTTASAGKIPGTVSKVSSPTATYTLTKTVLVDANSSNVNGLMVLSTASNGVYVYRLLGVTYGTF